MNARVITMLCALTLAGGCVLPSFETDESLADGGAGTTGEGGAAGQGGTDSDAAAGQSQGGAAGQGTGGASGAKACPDSDMVLLPLGFCIDKYETTQRDYKEWLDGGAGLDGQSSDCAWNDTYIPTCKWSAAGGDSPDLPVVCVDWCDAAAFCLQQGKYLCGKIGASGGTVSSSEQKSATADQWFNACSAGGTTEYPYGNSYDSDMCNTAAAVAVATEPGSYSDCHSATSPYSEIFDLSGNVAEWQNSCVHKAGETADFDNCAARGGSFKLYSLPADQEYLCGTAPVSDRKTAVDDIGFRCCADPK